MKLITWCLVVFLAGCANRSPPDSTYRPEAMSYYDLNRIQINDAKDCPRAENKIDRMYRQLEIKGFLNKNPEDLANEDDRMYNMKAHVIIWALRIGCNNPDRYRK